MTKEDHRGITVSPIRSSLNLHFVHLDRTCLNRRNPLEVTVEYAIVKLFTGPRKLSTLSSDLQRGQYFLRRHGKRNSGKPAYILQ